MKLQLKKAAALFVLIVWLAPESGLGAGRRPLPPDEDARPLHPADHWYTWKGQIKDPWGRTVVLRGLNLSEKHKHPPYLDFHREEDFGRVRDQWGMNTLRFLIEWSALEPRPGEINRYYLAQVRQRLDWAQRASLHVVLDMHQDVYGEGFNKGGNSDNQGGADGNGAPLWTCDSELYDRFTPLTPWFLSVLHPSVVSCVMKFWRPRSDLQKHLIRVWQQVAQSLGDHPAVIGFDIMNEPFSWGLGSFESSELTDYYNEVVRQVRFWAPHWLAFIEPSFQSVMGLSTSLAPNFKNYVYAPHLYDVDAESGKGFDPTHRAALERQMNKLMHDALSLRAPLWLGEYGGMPARPHIFEYMDWINQLVERRGLGHSYWNYTRDDWYGIVDHTGNEKPELMRALLRVVPEQIAGHLIDWRYDTGTREFMMRYEPHQDILAPTTLSIPKRLYPNGYQVTCDGCAFAATKEGLVITRPGYTKQETVRITPQPLRELRQ